MQQKQRKQVVTLTLDPDLVQRVEAWIATHKIRVYKNAVWEEAMRDFLSRRERRSAKGGDIPC